ncbi:MAG: PIG-L family deacetylase [Thermoflexales bacterium]|nr:PIG-L family deacetylase [Thermoflexales bacterium]MCS7324486.1 PIG-L family deacetylase [Thermoflexales bacterium]MDW8054256.1 PIG-L deacetylase family protein [Anaerolineae bacterium]MDW8292224.1 PIG-L deacetylase family protein [Anaerolineae bacterium]
MPKLLAIFAHPDDESFGPGGTLARYAAEGVRVHYLCATRGEAGTVDAAHLNGYRDVGELRTAELMCAARELGLAEVQFLGFRDSGMHGAAPDCLAQMPTEVVAARIAEHLMRVQPEVVITHDPFGGYGHPDHIAVHKAVLHAFSMCYGVKWRVLPNGQVLAQNAIAHAPALHFFVIPKRWMKLGVWLLRLSGQDPRRFGRNKDIDLVRIASWEIPVTARVDVRRYLRIKQRAAACHASQLPLGRQSWIARWLFRRGNGVEHFSRAYPAPSPGEALAHTLFSN